MQTFHIKVDQKDDTQTGKEYGLYHAGTPICQGQMFTLRWLTQ